MSSVAAIATPWPWTPDTHAALTARNAVLLLKDESNRLVANDEQSSKFHEPIGGPLDASAGATASAALETPMVEAAALGGNCCSGSSGSSGCNSACLSPPLGWHPPAGSDSTTADTAIHDRLRGIESPFVRSTVAARDHRGTTVSVAGSTPAFAKRAVHCSERLPLPSVAEAATRVLPSRKRRYARCYRCNCFQATRAFRYGPRNGGGASCGAIT